MGIGRIGPATQLLGRFNQDFALVRITDADEHAGKDPPGQLLEDELAQISFTQLRDFADHALGHLADLLLHAADVARAEGVLDDVAQRFVARIVHDDEGQDGFELREVVEEHAFSR